MAFYFILMNKTTPKLFLNALSKLEKDNDFYLEKQSQKPEKSSKRPEMQGPSDINDILSGLKKKPMSKPSSNTVINDGSTISIQDLKDMSGTKIPSKSTKRPTYNRTLRTTNNPRK